MADSTENPEQEDPRARWRKLPPDVLPTTTSKDDAPKASDHDVPPAFDGQLGIVRHFS